MRVIVLASWLVGALLGAGSPQDIRVVDLREPMAAPSQPTRSVRTFGNVATSHPEQNAPQPWPIRVSLLSATPDPGRNGLVMVDVRLEALRTVTVPVSRDRRAVDPDPTAPLPSLKWLLPELKLEGAAAGEGISSTRTGLSGSDAASGSLLTLEAGQSIRLQFATDVPALRRAVRREAPIFVRAYVLVAEGAEVRPTLVSDNMLQLTIPTGYVGRWIEATFPFFRDGV